jgi:hypothetical protein
MTLGRCCWRVPILGATVTFMPLDAAAEAVQAIVAFAERQP